MIILVDNYDSFSYNLYQLVGRLDPHIRVARNDELTTAELIGMNPKAVILSPGPGRPEDAGICVETAREAGKAGIPVLGVCLGHQAVCRAFGGEVSYARELMHGKQSVVTVENDSVLFAGLDRTFPVARYHSLAAVRETMPDCLRITALTEDGQIMAVEHRQYPVYGVQFHPESILTPNGADILKNFLNICHKQEV